MTKKQYNNSWKNQFLLSLRHWAQVKDKLKDPVNPDALIGPLDRRVESYFEIKNDNDEVLLATLRAVLHQQVHTAFHNLEVALEKCESLIESVMLCSLTIVGRELTDCVFYRINGVEYGDYPKGFENLYIEPQAQLGEYRVDFLLLYEMFAPDFLNAKEFVNGQEIPGTKVVRRRMIIECDGHDFHD